MKNLMREEFQENDIEGRWKEYFVQLLKGECLKKRGMDVRQARRMVQDRSEWWGFVTLGIAWV